jgi:hypothetical protein
MLSPVREEPQNLFSSEFITGSKPLNFENCTESAESTASERNRHFGEIGVFHARPPSRAWIVNAHGYGPQLS